MDRVADRSRRSLHCGPWMTAAMLLLLLLFSAKCFAQSASARGVIGGTVTDPQGDAVARSAGHDPQHGLHFRPNFDNVRQRYIYRGYAVSRSLHG